MPTHHTSNTGKILVLFVMFVFLIVCCCIGSFVLLIAAGLSQESIISQGYTKSVTREGNADETIAVIDVEGVILNADDGVYEKTMTQYVEDSIEEATKDEKVKAIILRMNTPGGGVYDSARITEKIYKAQEARKPVIAVMEEMSASGGYWISASTDRIFAQQETVTGSIGVLMQTVDYDELMNKIGVKMITITNTEGKNKVPDELDNPESEDTKIFKALLDETYDEFITVIQNGRKLKREEILPYADGRILTAKQALNAKLIDEIGDQNKAVEYLKKKLDLKNPNVTEYQRQRLVGWNSFSSKLSLAMEHTTGITQTGAKVYAMPAYMFDTMNSK